MIRDAAGLMAVFWTAESSYLRALLASRSGDDGPGVFRWPGRILELHWRYFELTSAF